MAQQKHLQEWNLQSVHVGQAFLGVPSPNFRRVTLDYDGEQWVVDVVLEHEDATDFEEVEEFAFAWEVLLSGRENYFVRTIVEAGPLPWPEHPRRVLYQRRENYPLD